jgi:hypothetical protein
MLYIDNVPMVIYLANTNPATLLELQMHSLDETTGYISEDKLVERNYNV